MLSATDICVHLGRRQILHDVKFSAAPGNLTAIVGPNGSGKTTLLKALTGELGYTGVVLLEGEDQAHVPGTQLATRRGVLPQSVRLAFPFTVLEVVRLGLLAGIDAADDTLPEKALAHVGLSGFAGRHYHELSGGEQQRCQLARVLVQVWEPLRNGAPSYLFLDEPVSALDIGHQLEVMQIARAYADAGGCVIAVMHDLNLTAMFADSVALMKEGRLVLQAAPDVVMTDQILSDAYSCGLRVNLAPSHGRIPFLLPQVAGITGATTQA
ncbi:heme ABC transporter ATP-binding protein [Yoonia sp. BS5-3]|uniref:Heme ABC transporter ATP-binding protein n=1 Tax=Yoonia phaeophyticola TaxID=3137369 RepID=A0ABZ2V541_9RHOB